ncbi:MAG: sugar ABC transporter ATP-binding protein [Deltaproteobacteria bacterium]|nr:sugar ABC transporter ATP-binding protein [Deltaproteobacteria bacterium]MBW2122868.1 sugar ABC transporter ATP-binding protein [Deltaproteobacteria bacterium]
MEPLLVISNISKHFGGVSALANVDLELFKGEILGLVGDNGAGKSTLLKILTGAYRPDSGRIYFEGREVKIRSPRHSRELGIEMVYQHLALCRHLDIASNLFLARELTVSLFGLIHFLCKRKMEQMAIETLRSLKIDVKDPREIVNNLSGGQQQAVAIGKAIRFGPKLVLMDEPTANLAVREASKVVELMRDLRGRGISIIFVTHRLQDIFEVADRVLVLKGGMPVDCRPTAELDQEELVRLMFIGKRSANGA